MHTILIPTDFSRNSRAAIDFVLDIYPPGPNRYVLMHVSSSRKTDKILVLIDDILEEGIQQNLSEEAEYIRSKSQSEVWVETVSECCDMVSALKRYTSENEVDLVVLGQLKFPGESNSGGSAFKSVLEIIRHIDTSILLVPLGSDFHCPGVILFATRLNAINDEADVEELISMTKSSGSHIDVLNVGLENPFSRDNPAKLEESINGYFKGLDYSLHAAQDSDPYRAIQQFSKERDCDLICIIYKKHSLIERLVRESVSEKLLTDLPRPVLILKGKPDLF